MRTGFPDTRAQDSEATPTIKRTGQGNESDGSRVALYARVSTLNGQDPEMQLRELREYAGRRGWEIVGEYTDTGVSGSKPQPACDCRHGQVKLVTSFLGRAKLNHQEPQGLPFFAVESDQSEKLLFQFTPDSTS
jgi:hypothetical protein